MRSLPEQIAECSSGRLCLVGLGRSQSGDDAAGIELVERIRAKAPPGQNRTLLLAGTDVEGALSHLSRAHYDHVVWCDAVDFGGDPGAVVWLGADEMACRLPQVSTHRLSLGLASRLLESSGVTRAWLLGIQAGRGGVAAELSPAVAESVSALATLWEAVWTEVPLSDSSSEIEVPGASAPQATDARAGLHRAPSGRCG